MFEKQGNENLDKTVSKLQKCSSAGDLSDEINLDKYEVATSWNIKGIPISQININIQLSLSIEKQIWNAWKNL